MDELYQLIEDAVSVIDLRPHSELELYEAPIEAKTLVSLLEKEIEKKK